MDDNKQTQSAVPSPAPAVPAAPAGGMPQATPTVPSPAPAAPAVPAGVSASDVADKVISASQPAVSPEGAPVDKKADFGPAPKVDKATEEAVPAKAEEAVPAVPSAKEAKPVEDTTPQVPVDAPEA